MSTALLFAMATPAQTPPTTPKKSAFDKPTLEAYVRHLWVLNPNLNVQVSDPKPSEVPGFQEVTVRISQGVAGQNVNLYISKDGSKIFQGTAYDVANNPFKPDLGKLKTQFQPSMGTPGAPVVLVVFSDLQCPHCKVEGTMLRQNLLIGYPKDVRLYFKDFPLEMHPWAKTAAMAGRCVFRQSATGFWDYHDFMFSQQEQITAENLKEKVMGWAKDRKDLDAVQLGQCMDTKATEEEVDKEIAEGKALELTGTPTLFINGRRLSNGIDWPNLKAIIDNEIEYQKTAKNAGEDCGCDLTLNVPGLPPTTAPGTGLTPPPKKK
ncbi:MAG: thioredoxin domain-containing protein [Acidobacteriia bacterium]|nr:thioredoxin domain-containing protein [Terriglobia bacterium]